MNVLLLLILFTVLHSVRSIILIPEELPSLLSVVYSIIPPVLKGTDSRLGIGFRLGPNADFQYQIELGPQNRTNPIGPDAPEPLPSKKRHVYNHYQLPKKPHMKAKPHWFETWSNVKTGASADESDKDIIKDQITDNEALDVNMGHPFQQQRPNEVASHLTQLYKQSIINKQSSTTTSTTETPTLLKVDATSNVQSNPPEQVYTVNENNKVGLSLNNVNKANVHRSQVAEESNHFQVPTKVKVKSSIEHIRVKPSEHRSKHENNTIRVKSNENQGNKNSQTSLNNRDQQILNEKEKHVDQEMTNEDQIVGETENHFNQIHSRFIQKIPN